MAARYWVGGTGNWDSTNTANWSTTSGGAGGASVPTAADSVFFDQAGTYTVTVTGNATCLDFTVSAGTVTFANGTSPTLTISGSMSLIAGTIWTLTGATTFNATTTGKTITTNGVSLASSIDFNGAGGEWTLGGALTTSSFLSVTAGTFTTNNYAVTTGGSFNSSGIGVRTINLGSSTVVATTGISFTSVGNLTLNAGTSQINITSNIGPRVFGAGLTFYNVSFTSTVLSGTPGIATECTFNNLSVAGRTTAGVTVFQVAGNVTVNGTLTLSAGTNATMRTFVRSDVISTSRTLTCAAVAALTDIDFRDITVAGAAAPVSGTRLGDCKGNSGITFDAPKTVYRVGTGTLWSTSLGWASSSGGSGDNAFFPLVQDTAVIGSAAPASGTTLTINLGYNIGTIDMSARTSNTITLSSPVAPAIYGNWVNGTGVTISGTGSMTFSGRGSQTITSAGKTFTQSITVDSPGGTVSLADAFTTNRNLSTAFSLNSGTFDLAGYNCTLSGAGSAFRADITTAARTLATGTGTLTIAGTSGFSASPTIANGLTVTGTGTISLTAATAKTFAGGGIQTYPTLNQGGAGSLTVTGSNKFANITNTYSAVGATSVLFTVGTTNEFTAFNLSGVAGKVCTLGSTAAGQATLKKSSAWYMGANSTDGGNNTGLSFTGSYPDYLAISYINGEVISTNTNFLSMF